MSSERYNFKIIESKWQKHWEKNMDRFHAPNVQVRVMRSIKRRSKGDEYILFGGMIVNLYVIMHAAFNKLKFLIWKKMIKTFIDESSQEVQDDFELIAFDFVSNPSTHGAFMHPMHESVDHTIARDTKYGKVEAVINDILRG